MNYLKRCPPHSLRSTVEIRNEIPTWSEAPPYDKCPIAACDDLGHGIVAGAAPGVAAEDTLEGKPETFEGTVLAEGFKGVLGTGWSVAAGRGSERGDAQLVELYQQYKWSDEYFLEHSHHLTFLRIFATVS